MTEKVVSDVELKNGIANMYSKMSQLCNNQSEAIKEDIDNFVIKDMRLGFELETKDRGTYRLFLEFKKVEE